MAHLPILCMGMAQVGGETGAPLSSVSGLSGLARGGQKR